MGYKKLSNEQEKILVEEYRSGVAVQTLMNKYGYKTKKSITDKVKKYYPDTYQEIFEEAHKARKGYDYTLEKIKSEFDAYFLGLLLTDGYISDNRQVGLDLTDEDCISFLSKGIGKQYTTYTKKYNSKIGEHTISQKKDKYRLLLHDKQLVNNLKRFGVIPNKSKILQPPQLLPEEEQYLPYIVRGIIDGDGSVNPTSYGAPQIRIVTASKDFGEWLKEILHTKLFLNHITINKNEHLYIIGTAHSEDILKVRALIYNKEFGMNRKYKEFKETFRDYNKDLL